MARASDGRLRLAEAQGRLWSGAGWIEVRDAHGRAGVARRLAWRVLPGSLLRGRLVAEVALDQAAKPFLVTISLSRIDIADAGINLPAAALGLGMAKDASSCSSNKTPRESGTGRGKLFAFHAFVICVPANSAPAANGA